MKNSPHQTLNLNNINIEKIELFGNGQEIPLYIFDSNKNDIFDSGDYLEFVGTPPPPSPYSGLNIYNIDNVYFLSFEADTSGQRYKITNGYSNNFTKSFESTLCTIHYEKDSLYERLGHAPNDKRDYWYWGKSAGQGGNLIYYFDPEITIPPNINIDSSVYVKVSMQGLSLIGCANPDHRVKITLSSQLIDYFTWDGATSAIYSGKFDPKVVQFYDKNFFQVGAFGDTQPCGSEKPYDEIRVNWFELSYWKYNRASMNHYDFKSPPNITGITRFNVYNWQRDNMKIFIPQKNKMITEPNFTHDSYQSTFFVDTLQNETEYFCAADDYFLTPDSILADKNSDLKNKANGADYIIITHPNFQKAAERLAQFRTTNFPDTTISSPRIFIADINDIYDEFSNGLLDPEAVRNFIKYAFENYKSPAPKYVVLIGDMSYDYRDLLADSRPNFIPSMPYHAAGYGQAASDNNLVAVAGDDLIPDLAIGRLSCETMNEADILLNKIINYPEDNSKKWKQNVLLLASGQTANDEQVNGFNDASFVLDNFYLQPNGIASTKVFRYPTKPRDYPFKGEGPEIRKGFDNGAVIANYYGHGGGYQWDLVFLNDDIYQLNNEGRLPFISSVTCYTAHFDNQDVFGEQFNKAPNKGSISFWGSSGLTYWIYGRLVNELAFRQIFNNKNYISGEFIVKSKSSMGDSDPYRESQIALVTLFGDPILKLALPEKPDFAVNSSDITITPETPLAKEDVDVKVKIKNYGIIFPGKKAKVELIASLPDQTNIIDTLELNSFGENDSLIFHWTPPKGGLYRLTVKINEIDTIPELDHSDNIASADFPVYDLGEPNIIAPLDGISTNKNKVKFKFVDNGYYLNLNLPYYIEIDTSYSFVNPIINSGALYSKNAVIEWETPELRNNNYFWRARIYNDSDSSQWSEARTFSVTNQPKSGFYAIGKELEKFESYNVTYSDSLKSLVLNKKPLPPKPSNSKYLSSFSVTLPTGLSGLSSITTDGKYIYYASMAYFSATGKSKIYKVGTGNQGTIAGQDYGAIPDLEVNLWHTMFYFSDGNIYAATGNAYSLLKINPSNGDTSRISVPDGMINEGGVVKNGGFYLNTDGKLVYNLSYKDSLGRRRYLLKVFDPKNNWKQLGTTIALSGVSYDYFSSFFVADGYLFAFENGESGFMRRFNLENGNYEEEWFTFSPFQGYYAWCYDWQNNQVYASVYRTGKTPKISKFIGTYTDDQGNVSTPAVGPASKWKSVSYVLENNSSYGSYRTSFEAFNSVTRQWDTLVYDFNNNLNIDTLNTNIYNNVKLSFFLKQFDYTSEDPIKIKSVNIDYESLPEIALSKSSISFSGDSLIQGFPVEIVTNIKNIGYSTIDSLKLEYYHNNEDSAYQTKIIKLPADSSFKAVDEIKTSKLLFNNTIKLVAVSNDKEFFQFNNVTQNSFYIARDSINPKFDITIDGKKIINGDIVSAKPEIVITLKDNSPLPIDTSDFTIVLDNIPLTFNQPNLKYSYTPYPNSEAVINWTPTLDDGKHTVEVLAKDASGNFFDSTSSKTVFYVYNKADITNVYNYPNPFQTETYFTFELRGLNVPEELYIKMYTIAGRLIKDIKIPSSQLQIGFNRIFWDGRDQDGDVVANGVYFYKIITKNNGLVKTVTQKLAKVN